MLRHLLEDQQEAEAVSQAEDVHPEDADKAPDLVDAVVLAFKGGNRYEELDDRVGYEV